MIRLILIPFILILSSCFGTQDKLDQTLKGGNKYVYRCQNSQIEYLIIDNENKINLVYEISGKFSGVDYEGFPPRFNSDEVYVTNASGYNLLGVGVKKQLETYLESNKKATKIINTFCKK